MDHMSGVGVIFDFGHGHNDRRGRFSGSMSQSDVVDEYGRSAVEEMEADNVRLFHVETRKSPGTRELERLELVPASFVPIVFSVDYCERPGLHNRSVVEFSGAHLDKLARLIAESMSEWGRCFVWGHKVSKQQLPGKQPFIRISPFQMNGPNEDAYMVGLSKLGAGIGRAVGAYMIDRGEGRRAMLLSR